MVDPVVFGTALASRIAFVLLVLVFRSRMKSGVGSALMFVAFAMFLAHDVCVWVAPDNLAGVHVGYLASPVLLAGLWTHLHGMGYSVARELRSWATRAERAAREVDPG